MTNAAGQQVAVVSSTTRDLPAHRREVAEACRAARVLALMMEDLPASSTGAIDNSLGLVRDARVYIGIYAFRYGTVPAGRDRSITEMEFDWACAMKLEMLVFVMDRSHPITIDQVEATQEAQDALERLKKRARAVAHVKEFRSVDHLGRLVESALRDLRERHEREELETLRRERQRLATQREQKRLKDAARRRGPAAPAGRGGMAAFKATLSRGLMPP